MKIELQPIGIIHTPFKSLEGVPRQSKEANGIKAEIEIFEPFISGLKDLEGFSHIILLYYLHKGSSYEMQIIPRDHNELKGLFATRSPRRPNPIGLSVVKLDKIEKNILHIENIDALDGTPLLDIKPYFPELDSHESLKTGWKR